jgi:hypothetical protein
MAEFVGEPIEGAAGTFDAAAMSRGEPGLPGAFVWRGVGYRIAERLDQWKGTAREGGRASGEVYLRRHYYRLGMSDGSVWTVYFIRQAAKSGSAKRRWFLYTIERAESDEGAPA